MATDKILTPEFRASFVNVFRPAKPMEGSSSEPKYTLTMLFKKGEDLSKLEALADAAAKEKWGDKIPKGLRSPFRDQGEKDYDGYEEGAIFINATSKQRPGLLNSNKEKIIDESEFYSGAYAVATVVAYAYDVSGNRGVSFGLQNILKTRDGDPLGGRSNPEDDFANVAVPAGASAGKGAGSIFGA